MLYHGKREHTEPQLTPNGEPVARRAEMHWISQPWNGEIAQMPYLAYMPDRDWLLR